MKTPYVFDTNSFRVLENYYPARFPSFWNRFDDAVSKGHVLSVKEVYSELERWASAVWILNWIKSNKAVFKKPTNAETTFIQQIFKVPHFLALVEQKKVLQGRPVADPFLIASAHVNGGCVVTEEMEKPNAAKIPNVCKHFGVNCTNVEGFLEQNGWQF